MALPRRVPPEPPYPPNDRGRNPSVSRWSSAARTHFEAKARLEASSALQEAGWHGPRAHGGTCPRIWTEAMPGAMPVITPDVSPTEDVSPEASSGDRTGTHEVGPGDRTDFLAPEVPQSPGPDMTGATDHEGEVEEDEVKPDPLPPPL
eukprot:11756907-Heterocapsa_arctica.AAC.1